MIPSKQTSRVALYFVTFITWVLVLVFYCAAFTPVEVGQYGVPHARAQVRDGLCDLEAVQCPEEQGVEGQIRAIAAERDFQWTDYLVRLAKCESNLNPQATGDSGKSRGVFQIHSGYHPDITEAQARSVRWATNWTIDRINEGNQHLWTCDRIVRARVQTASSFQ